MRTVHTFLAGAFLLGIGRASTGSQEPAALPLDQALKRATVGGKYRMLLRQIKIAGDAKYVGGFHEFGYRTETTCAEYTGLPKGYWVYSYPYWYIWAERAGDRPEPRAWGPEQATGKPDTPDAGDFRTAWASATQDGDDEWLMLEYNTPVRARSLQIFETYNPGAVERITAFALDGREVEVWRRPRLAIPQTPGNILRPVFTRSVLTNRVKLYLDSRNVPGWNEIDAVRLQDEEGAIQWATAATASSTYGLAEERIDPRDERIRLLEDENRRLRAELDALKRKTGPQPER